MAQCPPKRSSLSYCKPTSLLFWMNAKPTLVRILLQPVSIFGTIPCKRCDKSIDPSTHYFDHYLLDHTQEYSLSKSDVEITLSSDNLASFIYSGTPLLRPPLGKENLAFIEGCPYLRGQFELRKILRDITMWPC